MPLVFLHSQGFIPLLLFNDIPSLSVLQGFLFLVNSHDFAYLVPLLLPRQLAPSLPGSLMLLWDAINIALSAALDWSKRTGSAGPMRADSFKSLKL